MTDVVLCIRQHGRAWKLGTASAGTASDSPAGDIVWEVTLPRQLRARNASRDGRGQPEGRRQALSLRGTRHRAGTLMDGL
jgi:hypothetical protein